MGARQVTSKLIHQLISRLTVGVCSWLVGVKQVKGARKMIRTINELLSVIGKNIEDIQDPKVSQSDRQIKIDRAQNTAALAKQFINACGLVQKADVMSSRHDRTDMIIGEIK